MNDNARLETLRLLQTRPRGSDIPELKGTFPFKPETLKKGVSSFLEIAKSLIGTNRYIEEWREVRTAQEHANNTGLDIINNPEEFISHLQKRGNDDASFLIETIGFSSKITRSAPNIYTAGINYSGGMTFYANNTLGFFGYNEGSTPPHTLTLQEWKKVVSEIVMWRPPIYIGIGSQNYGIHDRVFEHRVWDGWLGWFPVQIDCQGLPSYALTFDVGLGTLVATQETNVITNNPAQRERAKEVEIALAQIGVLPTHEYLLGRAEWQ